MTGAQKCITTYLDISIECAEGGVVFEQVGCLLGATGVVDNHDLEVRAVAAVQASQELATNAAKSVDSNLALLCRDGHVTVRVGASLHVSWGGVALNHGRLAEGAIYYNHTECYVRRLCK